MVAPRLDPSRRPTFLNPRLVTICVGTTLGDPRWGVNVWGDIRWGPRWGTAVEDHLCGTLCCGHTVGDARSRGHQVW